MQKWRPRYSLLPVAVLAACTPSLKETSPDGGTADGPVTDLAHTVNLGGWMDSPHISPDGQELYFYYAPMDIARFNKSEGTVIVRGGPDRPGHTTSGDSPLALINADLYVARRQAGGGWEVNNLTTLNSADAQESSPYVSWDGRSLYFMRAYPEQQPVYWVARREGDGWGAPTLANLPVVNGNLTMDLGETTMFFDRSVDPNAASGDEIVVTTRVPGGPWADPTLLPPAVNDPDPVVDSQTPWLSRDGRRLYFHRFNKSGAGSKILVTDIYNDFRTTELDIIGPPYVPEYQDRLVAEPSLTEDEQTLYALVYSADAVAQVWSGQRAPLGRWQLSLVE